jgi:hypothetical protein
MKQNFEALSKKTIAEAVENGMTLCTWTCQGAEGNEPMEGVCRFTKEENGLRCEYISGDDITNGGFTFDGYRWLADYDYIVFGKFSKEG